MVIYCGHCGNTPTWWIPEVRRFLCWRCVENEIMYQQMETTGKTLDIHFPCRDDGTPWLGYTNVEIFG